MYVLAAAVVIVGVVALEQYDQRLAMMFAVMLLLALFIRYPRAREEIVKAFGLGFAPGGGGGSVQ